MIAWLRLLAIVAAVSVVSYGAAIVIFGSRIPYPMHFAVIFVIACTHRIVAGVRQPKEAAALIREDSDGPDMRMPDRPFAQVRGWEERLELVHGDAEYFRTSVVPALVELIDERLRLSHGISVKGDPEKARAVMGDRLWEFIDDAHGQRAPSQAELIAVVHMMEELWESRR